MIYNDNHLIINYLIFLYIAINISDNENKYPNILRYKGNIPIFVRVKK